MLATNDMRIAQLFRKRLEQVMPVLDLRIFGSRTKGLATQESDLDIYIELEDISPSLRWRISELAWELGLEMGLVISTFVVTRKQIDFGAEGANPLVLDVLQEGIRV